MKVFALLPLAVVAQAVSITVYENQKGQAGQFQSFDTASATCRNFNGANVWWNDKVSYVQIPANVRCQFWDDYDCKGASLVVPASSSGVDSNIPQNHNDKISSYACFQ